MILDPLIVDLIGVSRQAWELYNYTEMFKEQANPNTELVLGSSFSIRQIAEMLDAVLARKLVKEQIVLSDLHRPLQTAIIREQQRAKSG